MFFWKIQNKTFFKFCKSTKFRIFSLSQGLSKKATEPKHLSEMFVIFFCHIIFHQHWLRALMRQWLSALVVWHNQFHQQNRTKFYWNTQLEVMPIFSALSGVLFANKVSINLLTQKLLVKRWWNCHQNTWKYVIMVIKLFLTWMKCLRLTANAAMSTGNFLCPFHPV